MINYVLSPGDDDLDVANRHVRSAVCSFWAYAHTADSHDTPYHSLSNYFASAMHLMGTVALITEPTARARYSYNE